MDFYGELRKRVNAEEHDKDEYLELAKIAPTEKARKILKDISQEEKMHRRYLKELLEDEPVQNGNQETEHRKDSGLYANNEINYPSHIENAGVNPDLYETIK